ncbi:tRNA (adenine(22)-N(1))-methyltransferase [Alicyclobacillus sp. ALC3]|uniref:tRNA (adenine(22)-N(1))-methyltransferase n=1 Tax=Alicyclobacillus sp. ALC3 TaxID=2796143 RepID=UPI002378F7DA|nr:class I SAM-dependent methyltransferase [Alicyclobacillus sp. ALC3]WDL96351.1 SAM-dependent methyltransferase [Alicyclobacillus sp. ALC3]
MAVTLSARLQAIADFVPHGARVVDVGTDHALLPIFLVQTRVATSAIATDIAALPAHSAATNVRAHGLTNVVAVRVGPGLKTVLPGEVDTVIAAGMGGGTIRAVLSDCEDVLKRVERIIVQPMNQAQHVRSFFLENGWALTAERAILDHGRIYEVLTAVPGTEREVMQSYADFAGDDIAMSVALELGPRLLQDGTPEFLTRVKETLEHWRRRAHKMRQSGRDDVRSQVNHLGRQIVWLEAWYNGQAQNEGAGTR